MADPGIIMIPGWSTIGVWEDIRSARVYHHIVDGVIPETTPDV